MNLFRWLKRRIRTNRQRFPEAGDQADMAAKVHDARQRFEQGFYAEQRRQKALEDAENARRAAQLEREREAQLQVQKPKRQGPGWVKGWRLW